MACSNLRGAPRTIDYVHGTITTKYASSWGLKVKDNTRVAAIGSSMLHLATKTISLKPMMMVRPDMVTDLGLGKMVNDGAVFRRNFDIRTYEIGPDQKASIETIMNLFQETAVNHTKALGLLGDGLDLSPEMCKKNLIWVMRKLQVEVDRYPMCGDVVQIDTWIAEYGKFGVYSNWTFCDCETDEILIRASCVWLLMNKETRKLSKFPDEVRAEFDQHFVDTPPIVKHETRKWSTRDENIVDHVCNGLAPRWSDLDSNQHVNNAKYIGWILMSVPTTIVEHYELASLTLEYCHECRKDNVLQSHTFVVGIDNDKRADYDHVNCEHLLQLEIGSGGGDIMKGRTTWRSKHGKILGLLRSGTYISNGISS